MDAFVLHFTQACREFTETTQVKLGNKLVPLAEGGDEGTDAKLVRKEPHPKNRSEKIASIQVHKYLGCRMQWGGRERAWKRSGRCQAFQATASTCDNLVWLPRMSKFHCARFRNQVLPTPARRAFTCSPGEEANGVSSPGLLSPSWPESPLPHGCRHRRLRFSPPRSCLQLCSQPFRPIKVPSSDGFAPK